MQAFGPNPEAESLIAAHVRLIPKFAAWKQRSLPGVDVEFRVAMALYKAAYTFRGGKGRFVEWWRWKVRGEVSRDRDRLIRYARGTKSFGPIRVRSLQPYDNEIAG